MKPGARAYSFRLSAEAVTALGALAERWECSQTRAVERALTESRERPEIGEVKVELEESSRDRAIRLAQEAKRRLEDARVEKEEAPLVLREGESLALCVHCDEQFTLARGVKAGSLCPGCMRKGHRNMVPCRGCEQDIELARRRAADPGGAERTDIDYADSQV